MHAREYTPTELTGRFIEMLIEGYNTNDAQITSILQHTEIHIIIHVNPDGRYMAERFPDTYWRKNMNSNDGCKNDEFVGVDINRNFDFLWGDTCGASSDSCSDEYYGSGPNSEPETQAVINYAKKVFPVSQRRDDPEKQMDEPLDEDIMGVYIDVHSTGRYIYYPWGHRDATSPNDDAFQAIARKMSHYNGYDLWASGYDFLYPVSGDSSDYMYAVMGVASLGLELGFNWYESCNAFENVILPNNLPALLYAASIASKPLSLAKGPDVLDVVVDYSDDGGDILVTAEVSEGIMVNSLNGEADHVTGDQDIVQVTIYFDVHLDDFIDGDLKWEMSPIDGDFDSGEEIVDATISTSELPSGSHILHLQAMDSSGYLGPVKSVSIQIEKEETNTPTSAPITTLPTPSPTTNSPTINPTPSPTTPEPSGNPTTASPSPNPTQAPITRADCDFGSNYTTYFNSSDYCSFEVGIGVITNFKESNTISSGDTNVTTITYRGDNMAIWKMGDKDSTVQCYSNVSGETVLTKHPNASTFVNITGDIAFASDSDTVADGVRLSLPGLYYFQGGRIEKWSNSDGNGIITKAEGDITDLCKVLAPAATTTSPSNTATMSPSNQATTSFPTPGSGNPSTADGTSFPTPAPTATTVSPSLKPAIEVNMNKDDLTVATLPVDNGNSNTSSASMKALTGTGMRLITFAPAVYWLALSLLS